VDDQRRGGVLQPRANGRGIVTVSMTLEALEAIAPGARRLNEGGLRYVHLPGLQLPAGCRPAATDCLLCLDAVNGYPSRLYFAERVTKEGKALNWNGDVHILGRAWHAYSWNYVSSDQSEVGILSDHLAALR
jgi:hypothetical protein